MKLSINIYEEPIIQMTPSEKIKTKIKTNKAQYNLDGQNTQILALSSGNISKYKFLNGKDVLQGEYLL